MGSIYNPAFPPFNSIPVAFNIIELVVWFVLPAEEPIAIAYSP